LNKSLLNPLKYYNCAAAIQENQQEWEQKCF